MNRNLIKFLVLFLLCICLASCGEETVIEHIHEWGNWETVKKASCKEEGLRIRKCKGCGDEDKVILNLTAHNFNEGQIVEKATCQKEGKIVFECLVCSKNVEQKIPTLEHVIEVISGNPSDCYNNGLTDGKYCKLCDTVLVEQIHINALGHAWGESKVTKKATCLEDGEEKVTCTTCSASRTFTIPKLSHNIEYLNCIDPTCTSKGKTGEAYCKECDSIVQKSSETFALGHNYVDGRCIRCLEKESEDGMKFKKIDGKYYLSDAGLLPEIYFTVPLMYNNEYVVGILDGAFDKGKIANIIELRSTITDIEIGAFDNCGYIYDIVIEKDNPVYYAENGCLIEKETSTLIAGAANGNIPNGVVSIERGAFKNRIGLMEIILPESVKEIAEDAFAGCSNLMTIEVSPQNEVYYSQDSCLLLKENNLLLLGCQESVISEGIEVISSKAFENCSDITKINLPNSLKMIMPGAFTNCQLVTSLYIPENLTEVSGAFEGMISLKEITVSPNNPKYTVIDGCLVEKKTNKLVLADKRGIIPEGIEIIGTGAFAGNEELVSVILPNSVKELEPRAFANCINLESFKFSKAITSIPDSCFEGCEYLEFIEVPRHITSIGAKAFKDCIRFERLEIRNTIQYIGEKAFENCVRLYFVCEVKVQPETWHPNWNPDNRAVLWGHYIIG